MTPAINTQLLSTGALDSYMLGMTLLIYMGATALSGIRAMRGSLSPMLIARFLQFW